jgi:hypothetical protein
MSNEIEKIETLTPQQETFCVFYTNIGTETFCHGTLSAEQAEYAKASCRTTAWKLLRTPKIRERIAEIHHENMSRNLINVDSQLAKLEHLRRKAEERGDLSSAIRAVELVGKYLSMFSDKHVIVTEQPQHEIDPEKAAVIDAALNDFYSKKYLAQPKTTEQKITQSNPVHPQTTPPSTSSPIALTRD